MYDDLTTVGRALLIHSDGEVGGNRPGNFNETETIVVVVALFIRIRTTILVVCVCIESVRGIVRERVVRGSEDIIITRVFLHKKTMM